MRRLEPDIEALLEAEQLAMRRPGTQISSLRARGTEERDQGHCQIKILGIV